MIAYSVNDMYCAFQGEGVLAGTPMVLIRLQGCGVGCPFCDTKETWEAKDHNIVNTISEARGTNPKYCIVGAHEIATEATRIGPNIGWALVTGGEPAEHDLVGLVDALHGEHFNVALETSGTVSGFQNADFDWACISPKMGMPGGREVDKELLKYANEIKHVVGTEKDIAALDSLLESVAIPINCIISLQPISMNEKATRLCSKVCLERGWNLSIQIHRYIDAR